MNETLRKALREAGQELANREFMAAEMRAATRANKLRMDFLRNVRLPALAAIANKAEISEPPQ